MGRVVVADERVDAERWHCKPENKSVPFFVDAERWHCKPENKSVPFFVVPFFVVPFFVPFFRKIILFFMVLSVIFLILTWFCG